ncbi:MAG: Bro-N domain-containing protein [Geobacteraceae bacterium]|nr:Bro-N domain-containing protein [Geobacteraceae bacterium]
MHNNSGAGAPGLFKNEMENKNDKIYNIFIWLRSSTDCRLLGISNYSLAVQKYLDEDEQQKTTTYIGGYGKKRILVINNSGMLKLVNAAQDDRVPLVKQRARNIPARCLPEDQQHLRLAA